MNANGSVVSSGKTVPEFLRQVPVYDEVDVLVCGGGPAGFSAAAVAAALSIQQNCSPTDVDVPRLQDRLRHHGAILDEKGIRAAN